MCLRKILVGIDHIQLLLAKNFAPDITSFPTTF